MKSIQLLLVSTLLFRNLIIAPPSNKKLTVMTRRTMLKPYMSRYDKKFEVSSSDGTCSNKSRNVFTATVKKTICEPFTSMRWNAISTKYVNNYDSIEVVSVDQKAKRLYENLYGLISIKLGAWLHLNLKPNKVNEVEYYFGFDPKTIGVIDISITTLLSEERKRKIFLGNFISFLYYMLDIKNVVDPSVTDRGQIVTDRLQKFYDNIDATQLYESRNKGEKKMLSDLISSLHSFYWFEEANPSCGVSVSSMKMWLLIQPTTNTQLETIQNLTPFSPLDRRTVKDYVRSFARETEVQKINEYHVSILSVLIWHVFRYVHKHFMFSLKLLHKYRLDDSDQNTICTFCNTVRAYMSILVDRYFEFKGEISQEIVDALFPILFFFNPSDPQNIDNFYYTEEIASLFAVERPYVSFLNYNYKDADSTTLVKNEIKKIMDKAVVVLTKSFTVYDGEQTLNAWSNDFENYFAGINQDKTTLLKEIKKNYDQAFSVLYNFHEAFLV